MAANSNLRTIYDLLDKLSRSFSPDHHKDILKSVTTSISDSQQGFLSGFTCDESIIATKIKSNLSTKSETNLNAFVNLHEELCTLANPRLRTSVLAFLLQLSDKDSNLPNPSQCYGTSVFSLPVSNRLGESSSSSVSQLFKSSNSKVSKAFLKVNLVLINLPPFTVSINFFTQFCWKQS